MAKKKAEAPANPGDETALRTQLDQVLDLLIEQQDQIAALKSAQVGPAAVTVEKGDKTAELNAELDGLLDEFKDYPLINVFERRALVGVDANTDIRLKGEVPLIEDPGGAQRYWKLRWFNCAKEGRAQQMVAEGYDKVAWEDLQDQESVATGARIDAYVRRGERGQEVLGKIPFKLYVYKKKRDAARQAGLLASESGVRHHVAERVASMVGSQGGNADQAGSFVHGGINVTLTQCPTETVTF